MLQAVPCCADCLRSWCREAADRRASRRLQMCVTSKARHVDRLGPLGASQQGRTMGGEPPQHGALCRSLQRALPWHAGKLPPTAALSRCSLDAILMVREVWQWLLSLPAAFSTRFGCCSCRLWATSASSSWTCQLSPRAKLICEISCALSHARQSHLSLIHI